VLAAEGREFRLQDVEASLNSQRGFYFTGFARVCASLDTDEKKSARMAATARWWDAFQRTREGCFISLNDILEQRFRTFIVSG
jgi:hypothetical protein